MNTKNQVYETTFPSVFTNNVAAQPDRLAIVTPTQAVTYAELNHQADRIVAPLFARKHSAPEPICLLFNQEIAAFAATIAVLKSGNFYITLDPLYPQARLIEILCDSGASILLTNNACLALARQLCPEHVTLLNIDEFSTTFVTPPALAIAPDAYAYIGYTSGSTGKAKGVIETHRNHICHWRNLMQAQPNYGNERVLFLNRLSFSGGQLAFYTALLAGATLYLYDLHSTSMADLPAWIQQQQITVWNSVPTVFRTFVEQIKTPEQVASLRLLRLASDAVLPQDIEAYRRLCGPRCQLWLGYALTEAKTVTMAFLDHATSLVPAEIPNGQPINGMEVWILDETGQRLGPNQVGEIVVRSRYVSPGYWRDSALTAARFRPDPDEPGVFLVQTGDLGKVDAKGNLIHKGRKDTQVKVRGYRVELSEIEAHLASLDGVQEAAVRTFPLTGGDTRLAAYVVSNRSPQLTGSQLRQLLSQRLPDYMIPATFTLLERLPVNRNGKIDRAALLPPSATRPALDTLFAPPRTVLEQAVAVLWCELLELDTVGINDNFFELGGHSLLAVRLIWQIEQKFQQVLPLRQFIFKPTVAHLATLIRDLQTRPMPGSQMASQQPGASPLDSDLSAQSEICHLYDALEDRAKKAQLRANVQSPSLRFRLVQKLLGLSQPVSIRLFAWLVQQTWVQQSYLAKETELVEQFLADLGQQPAKQQNLVVQCLFFNCLMRFGVSNAIFRRLKTERTITIEGLERLEAARLQRQGVILLDNHFYQAPYFRSLKLAQVSIGNMAPLIENLKFNKRMAEHILYTRQLELAYQTLRQGGVISLAPDVNRGHGSQITLPFHGRMHQFRRSFAEVALLTHAQVFFVASELSRYDEFSFRLVGPLDMGTNAMSAEERVQWLMEQYVTQLRLQWVKTPWAVSWGLMRDHFAYAPIATASLVAAASRKANVSAASAAIFTYNG